MGNIRLINYTQCITKIDIMFALDLNQTIAYLPGAFSPHGAIVI